MNTHSMGVKDKDKDKDSNSGMPENTGGNVNLTEPTARGNRPTAEQHQFGVTGLNPRLWQAPTQAFCKQHQMLAVWGMGGYGFASPIIPPWNVHKFNGPQWEVFLVFSHQKHGVLNQVIPPSPRNGAL